MGQYHTHINIHITGILGGEEREKGEKKLLKELIVENFPNLVAWTDFQLNETESHS